MIQNSIAYLVYFGCRGVGHYYRYAIYQIGLPYEEIYINTDGSFPECLKEFGISLSDVPCIILEGKVLKDLYPTLRYLCRKYNRQDLLGNTLHEQTIISQIFSKNSKKKSNVMSIFLRYVPKIKKQPQNMRALKLNMVKEMGETPGCSQVCSLLYSQTGNYIFDHITIGDFLFYQNCFYLASFFDDVCSKKIPIYFAYKNFFERTQFYRKNKQKIEKFKFLIPQFDEEINQGLRLMRKDQKDKFFLK